MDLGLKDKVAIITGGGRGIGYGIAQVFAEEGCNVVIADFAPVEKTKEACKKLEDEFGIKALAVFADISKEEDVKNIFAAAVKEFGTVDYVMNNAGLMGPSSVKTLTVADIRKYEAVTVEGTMIMCREAVNLWDEQQRGGHIVNTISKTAYRSDGDGNPIYAATKGAVRSFTGNLAKEVGRRGIYVNGLVPGYVATEGVAHLTERSEKMKKIIPIGREATPKEIGYAAAFLCSDKAAQIMGVALDVTGGTLMNI